MHVMQKYHAKYIITQTLTIMCLEFKYLDYFRMKVTVHMYIMEDDLEVPHASHDIGSSLLVEFA